MKRLLDVVAGVFKPFVCDRCGLRLLATNQPPRCPACRKGQMTTKEL